MGARRHHCRQSGEVFCRSCCPDPSPRRTGQTERYSNAWLEVLAVRDAVLTRFRNASARSILGFLYPHGIVDQLLQAEEDKTIVVSKRYVILVSWNFLFVGGLKLCNLVCKVLCVFVY